MIIMFLIVKHLEMVHFLAKQLTMGAMKPFIQADLLFWVVFIGAGKFSLDYLIMKPTSKSVSRLAFISLLIFFNRTYFEFFKRSIS
jgi:hypothetical protein